MEGPISRNEAKDAALLGGEQFLALLDTLPYPAFVIASGSRAVHYNAAFVSYVGHRPGPDAADRTALHHPDDRAVLEQARAAAVPTSSEYVVELRWRRHDGGYRWHRVHNKPLFREGERIAYLGTAVDIHDRLTENALLEQRVRERTAELEAANRSLATEEARYRDLYNQTPVALHSSDGDARLLDVNDTWLRLFGYGRAAAIGRSLPEFMTPESASAYRERAWPAMLASRGELLVVDYRFVTAAGREFDGRVAARGVFDESGQLLRTWCATIDVTAEKEADRALRQAQRMEAIGQLTAGIAHDFNNLLTAILGSLEMAAHPKRSGEHDQARTLRLVAAARSAAERGTKLTGQLLAFSRQQRIVAEPTDVNRLVEGLRPLLASAVGDAAEVAIEVHPGLPEALADATQLELAVLNLVINARDAMAQSPPGGLPASPSQGREADASDGRGGRITVRTASVEVTEAPSRPEDPEPGSYVGVEVRDDGPGIPEAVRDRMFEPFFTTKGAGRGSGLGLAQVLGIAKQLGGGVRVVTAPGEGTAVSLLLPQAASRGGAAAAPASPADRPSVTGRPIRILVVDDDPDVRATASEMLREAGHQVEEAESGSEALDRLARADGDGIHLLLADVIMPGMDGVELAAQARQARPGLPVLLMTGFADEDRLSAEWWGSVLPKPFHAAELEAAVARAAASPASGAPAASLAGSPPSA